MFPEESNSITLQIHGVVPVNSVVNGLPKGTNPPLRQLGNAPFGGINADEPIVGMSFAGGLDSAAARIRCRSRHGEIHQSCRLAYISIRQDFKTIEEAEVSPRSIPCPDLCGKGADC